MIPHIGFVLFVVAWVWFSTWYFSFPQIEKRLTKQIEPQKLRRTVSYLKIVEKE